MVFQYKCKLNICLVYLSKRSIRESLFKGKTLAVLGIEVRDQISTLRSAHESLTADLADNVECLGIGFQLFAKKKRNSKETT